MGSHIDLGAGPDTEDQAGVPQITIEGIDNAFRTETGCIIFTLYATRGNGRKMRIELLYPPGVAERINGQVRAFLSGKPFLAPTVAPFTIPN